MRRINGNDAISTLNLNNHNNNNYYSGLASNQITHSFIHVFIPSGSSRLYWLGATGVATLAYRRASCDLLVI